MKLTQHGNIMTAERNGECWQKRGMSKYVRFGQTPAQIIEMRGDPVSYFGGSAEILQVEELSDGWARYWVVDTDPELQECTADLVRLYERGA